MYCSVSPKHKLEILTVLQSTLAEGNCLLDNILCFGLSVEVNTLMHLFRPRLAFVLMFLLMFHLEVYVLRLL